MKTLFFKDYPEFTPNLTPKQILKNGSFGGGYFRDIYSSVTGKNYKNYWKKYPLVWFKDIPENYYNSDIYQKDINKYKVHAGVTFDKDDVFGLKYWEYKHWINPQNPYGWFDWYCDFFLGKRSEDDQRQIKRWLNFCGPKGRFKTRLIKQIIKNKTKFDDFTVSPITRQSLQHWAYILTKKDFEDYVKNNEEDYVLV